MNSDNEKKAATGNASNPTADPLSAGASQLIPEKGEKYLREAGNIEDLPDEDDVADAEYTLRNKG